MSTPPPPDRAALGRERLAARARRVSVLRRRVVAAALASFALAWGVIALDGPMGVSASTTTASTRTTSSGATAAVATATATAAPSADQSSSDDSTAAPVTTAQS